MRIYVVSSNDKWWALAGDVPGTASEDAPDRDEAIARCRRYAADEIEAFGRLGAPLEVSPDEEIIEWKLPWWLIPDWLVPVTPALRDAAVVRMDEIAVELDGFLDEIGPDEWDRRPDGAWSIRRVLDHVAGGFEIGLRRLERWPLDPAAAQSAGLDELVARLRAFTARRFATEHSGMNQEEGRVRWTPRKVLRATRRLQEATIDHYARGGPAPRPIEGHADAPDDDEPITESDLQTLINADQELQRLASADPRVRVIASSYRYYRDRLSEWPDEARDRWRAMRAAFAWRIRSLDETDLAIMRRWPNGQCSTLRMELGLGLSHVREHLAQMRDVRGAVAAAS